MKKTTEERIIAIWTCVSTIIITILFTFGLLVKRNEMSIQTLIVFCSLSIHCLIISITGLYWYKSIKREKTIINEILNWLKKPTAQALCKGILIGLFFTLCGVYLKSIS